MRWVRHGQRVDQRVTIPVSPFNPKILGELVDDFFNRHEAVTTYLVDRLAGTEL